MAFQVVGIEENIEKSQNFLLSGGAGSGKTYALMQVLDLIFKKNSKSKVACITYTNVAVDEIKERSSFKNIEVSTIHDFLWNNIKIFQKNLKTSIVDLVNAEKNNKGSGIKTNEEVVSNTLVGKIIQYKEYRKIEEGIISHDEVLSLSRYMCESWDLI